MNDTIPIAFHSPSLLIVHYSKLDCEQTAKTSNLIYNNGIKTISEWPQAGLRYSPAEGAVVATQSCGSHHTYLLPAIDVQEEWGRRTTVLLAATLTELTKLSLAPLSLLLCPSHKDLQRDKKQPKIKQRKMYSFPSTPPQTYHMLAQTE